LAADRLKIYGTMKLSSVTDAHPGPDPNDRPKFNVAIIYVLLDQRGMKRTTVTSTLDYLRKVADRKGISFYTHTIFGLSTN
jgi:hypothetical protein